MRSMPLATLAPLLQMREIAFVSLQKGPPAEQVRAFEAIEDVSADLHDYADTAAAVAALDLVISVDTSVIHVAGALFHQVFRGDDVLKRMLPGTNVTEIT